MKGSGRIGKDAKQRLASQSRKRIALVIDTALASGRDMLRGVSRFHQEYGGWELFHQPRGLEDLHLDALERWDGDGIIARVQRSEWMERLREKGVPIIDLLGLFPVPDVPRVLPADSEIAEQVLRHFLDRGFREFGFVGFEDESWSQRRESSFRDLVQNRNKSLHHFISPRHATGVSWEMQMQRLGRWLTELPKPIGIFVASDQRGPETIEACHRNCISIPEDVAVVGVDNDELLCEICQPSLSSLYPNHHQVGYEAARCMHDWLEGHPPPEEILVSPGEIAVRQSSDILAVGDKEVVRALRYILEQSHRAISVDDVAAASGLSRSVLQRRFRNSLGITVNELVVKTRIKKAQSLLVETSLSLQEIADRCGFVHQEYFGVVFRREMADTPAAYRRRHRKPI